MLFHTATIQLNCSARWSKRWLPIAGRCSTAARCCSKPASSSRSLLPVEGSLVYVLISNVVRNACAHTRRGHVRVRLAAGHVAINVPASGFPRSAFQHSHQHHAKGEASPGHGRATIESPHLRAP